MAGSPDSLHATGASVGNVLPALPAAWAFWQAHAQPEAFGGGGQSNCEGKPAGDACHGLRCPAGWVTRPTPECKCS